LKAKAAASARFLGIAQTETYRGDDWWSWAVWIDGPDAELNRIAFVEYTLHPTFAEPVRTVSARRTKFRLSSGGWGTFTVYACIYRKDGSTLRRQHELALSYPDEKTPRVSRAAATEGSSTVYESLAVPAKASRKRTTKKPTRATTQSKRRT
jgi:transcription initiation factor IIF auxiliary subunit